MARYLALDWDHNHLSLAQADIGRGGVRVQNALVFPEAAPLGLGQAEEAGQRLRDHLKEARLSSAPVIACLGRDRLIVRDLRYPAVPDHEEPAVIRFQALKEMTNTPDEVVVDYVRIGELPTGERRALVLIARRDHLQAYQALCKAAGLKLAGITARPLGLATCLERVAGTTVLTPPTDPPGAPAAVVAVGDGWAEFVVCKGGTPLLARSMNSGPGLAAEVKRNLTVYSGQAPSSQQVRAVYVAGGPENAALREKLRQLVEVPVHVLDPFAGSEQAGLPVPERRGGFAGLVGVLHLKADKRGLPCDFLQPKQPRPQQDPNRRRTLLLAALAATVLLALGALGYLQIADLNKQIAAQAALNSNLDRDLSLLKKDADKIKVLGDWNDQSIVWLDELYDLGARFPDPDKDQIRLSMLSASVLERAPNSKDPHVGRISLKGVLGNDHKPLDQFVQRISEDGNYTIDMPAIGSNRGPEARAGFTQQFEIKRIGVKKRLPEKYTQRLDEEVPVERPERGRRSRR